MTVIDGATGDASTMPVGSNPESISVDSSRSEIYVANSSDKTVTVIDGATSATHSLAVGSGPSALAVNPLTNRIFVANSQDGSVSIIDGTQYSTHKIAPDGSKAAAAVNPVTGRVYVVDPSGLLTVYDGRDGSTVATLQLPNAPGFSGSAIAVNPINNRVYVAIAIQSFFGELTTIDGDSNSIIKTSSLSEQPYRIRVNAKADRVYVTADDALTSFNATTGSPVSVGGPNCTHIIDFAVNDATNKIYVSCYDTLSIMSRIK